MNETVQDQNDADTKPQNVDCFPQTLAKVLDKQLLHMLTRICAKHFCCTENKFVDTI